MTRVGCGAFSTQLRRAITDNDRFGYNERWTEAGINEPMRPVPLEEGEENARGNSLSFQYISASLVDRYDEDSKGQLKGLTCRWREAAVVQDKDRIKLIKVIQSFSDDKARKYSLVRVRSCEEEKLAYSLAGALAMGRRSIFVNTSLEDAIAGGFAQLFSSQEVKGDIYVLLWKPYIMMCCTIPAAGVLGGTPMMESVWRQVQVQRATMYLVDFDIQIHRRVYSMQTCTLSRYAIY